MPAAACALAIAIASAAPLSAQGVPDATARLARMRAYGERLDALGFSGQLLVAEHGEVVFEQACGWADARFGRRMTPEARLAVGSVTKSFVAAAVLALESEGALRLEDRLSAHLDGVPDDKSAITLAQLLTHQSGLPFDIPDGLATASRDEVVSAVLAQALETAPGERFAYSNAGFDLLAAVVERRARRAFDAHLRGGLFARAGIGASGLAGAPGLPGGPAAVGQGPWAEAAAWAEWPRGWSGTGSGRMVMTARDLWRWGEALRDGRAIGAAAWQRMRSGAVAVMPGTAYGLGLWRREPAEGGATILIGGDVPGYRAECRILPEEDRVVVVLINRDLEDAGRERQLVASMLLRLARGEAADLPPAVLRGSADAAEPIEGVWRLPSSAQVVVWREAGALRLAVRGQEAVELFEPPGGDGPALRAQHQRTSEVLVRAAVRGDSTLAASVLTAEEHARVFPFLRDRLRVLRAMNAPLAEVQGLGVCSDAADPAVFRSRVALRFEDRTETLELEWRERSLEQARFTPERSGARVLTVAPRREGGYAAWDASRGHAVAIDLQRAPDGSEALHIGGTAGTAIATRAR